MVHNALDEPNALGYDWYMNVATFEGIVENGQVKLPENVRLPERTKVYVVIPGAGQPGATRLMSPRLAHPEQAQDFQITVVANAKTRFMN